MDKKGKGGTDKNYKNQDRQTTNETERRTERKSSIWSSKKLLIQEDDCKTEGIEKTYITFSW